jgi:isopenicillin N synthase-like dioxygenase
MATLENAKLRKIPFRDLYVGKAEAIEALIQACKTEGFFYLDLCGDETARMVTNVEKLELLGQDIFNCAEEEKTRYDFRKIGRPRTTGYLPFVSLLMMMMLTFRYSFKSLGSESGPVSDKPDGFELYMVLFSLPLKGYRNFCLHICQIPQNEILLDSYKNSLVCPSLIHEKRPFIEQCMVDYRYIGGTILRRLVGSESPEVMQAHRAERPCASSLSFLKYPPYFPGQPNVGHIAHTDASSLTILHSSAYGLQVLDPNSGSWTFVEPLVGHLVVNVGDSLKFLSGGVLKSCLHRVVPHEEAACNTRYSVCYFMRPNEDAKFTAADGKIWQSRDWTTKKFDAFAAPASEQDAHGGVLAGGVAVDGLWWDPNSYRRRF